MWPFNRKTAKNRRLERTHVLDVKLRSEQVRATRFRVGGMVLGAVFGALFIGLSLWKGGEMLLDRFIYENNSFAIQQVPVSTDGVIAPEFIRYWANLKPGQNLLALDLGLVKRSLEMKPYIASASVERVLPNTLRIRVSERQPVARVEMMQRRPDGTYDQIVLHLDESGFVFKPLDPRLRARQPEFPNEQVPVISGVDVRELLVGETVKPSQKADQIVATLAMLREFEHSPMVGFVDIQRIDLGAPETLHVYTAQGSEVHLATDDFPRQFQRWRMVYDHFLRQGKSITSVDLSVENNVPVKLVEAATVPPSRPKNPVTKPARTTTARKKHV